MSLVSSTFIGVIILTTILYYISPKKFKPYVLLIISILVYSSLGIKSLIYIVISTITTYTAALLFQKNKLDGISLTNPTLKNVQKVVLFKKVGQFVCESSGKISIKATMTYRIKTTAASSYTIVVNYVLNNKSYAEMDMGATSNQDKIENSGVTLVKTSFDKDTDNVWSQPATVSDDSNVITVSKGDVLTFFIGSRAGGSSSYTYHWDIQNATVEGFAIR